MPIFDFDEFSYRNVLKLAPDAFVTFNGALGAKIVSPLKPNQFQQLDVQGGITSINVNASITPGSGKASITVVAPKYRGLHEDYYVTLASGIRVPYFLPMMEVKVYMKGRYLSNKEPTYYPVFWGFISNVSEDYSDGVTSFNLGCSDILTWWKYQKITIGPAESTAVFGGPKMEAFPTVFRNMNPWQIIMKLVADTGWKNDDNTATYNFLFPKRANSGLIADLGNIPAEALGALAVKVNEYWSKRFSFSGEMMPLEMFGLASQLSTESLKTLRNLTLEGVDLRSPRYNTEVNYDIGLDYNLLARVQPFGDIDLFGGTQPMELSKLEIAQKVCEYSHMEFYLDTNGIMVFKPPFYNMDVTQADVPTYMIDPSDVINYNEEINSDAIVTFMELTAPKSMNVPTLDIIGFHIDWDLMTRYGMRYQKAHVWYGNDSRSLRLICAAEMAKVNGKATTGSVSIPLRPEVRLGYPVYIGHKDAFFYVTNISHSFSFGSSATTSLSMEVKRERIYDSTGEISSQRPANVRTGSPEAESLSNVGRILKGFVWKFRETSAVTADNIFAEQGRSSARKRALERVNYDDSMYVKSLTEQEKYKRLTEVMTGPRWNGFYEVVPADIYATPLNQTQQSSDVQTEVGAAATVMSNELLMITDNTIPYTDLKGYRHIGAFPYGANFRLVNGVELIDGLDMRSDFEDRVQKVLQDNDRPAPITPDPVEPFKLYPENMEYREDEANKNLIDMMTDPDTGAPPTLPDQLGV